MAEQQQAARPAQDLPHQPGALAGVEVIARFVKNQPVGLRQPGAGQRDPLALATAQAGGGRIGPQLAKADLVERLLQPRRRIPGVADQRIVRFIDGTISDALQRTQHAIHAGQRSDCGKQAGIEFLRHVMDTAIAAHGATGRQGLAGQQPRQHAFAHAIGADQADAARREGKLKLVKQGRAIGQHARKTIELQ